MSTTSAAARRRARRALDGRMEHLRPLTGQFAMPNGGWVRAIREALGMSAEQLASRMHVSGTSVRSLETNERSGRVQLATLKRAADALDCELVYALVPRRALEEQVRAQAIEKALPGLSRVEHTMLLEDQLPGASAREWLRSEAVEAVLDRPGLWDAT